MKADTTLAIIQSVLIYGPNAIISIADLMQSKDEITADDIKSLKIDKNPEEFFDG